MKLEIAVADVSQSKKDLTIEVPADEVKAEFEKTYEEFMRHAKLPGFRPGRVPRGVVKQRFGKEIKDQVVGRLVPDALETAIMNHHLRIVGKPMIEDISVNEGEPLKFKASIEVLPEFELGKYKGLKATKRVTPVTGEDVENVIEQWREAAAEFVPVEDRPSQEGDFVSVNLVGKYLEPQESHEQEDLKVDDLQVELGAAGVQPEFNENLRGVKAGDVREFRVTYPEDFNSKGLAGKTLDFTATVVAVRRKEVPEADDNFAQEFGEHKTIEEMREKVREDLVRNAEHRADMTLRDELLGQLLNSHNFELPASLIEQQAAERAREYFNYLMRSGVPPQRLREMNWEEQMGHAKRDAARDIRAALIVSRIGDLEEIEITPQEVDNEIERMAVSMGESAEVLKARLTKDDALSSIENRLRYQKVVDLIVNSAEIAVEESIEKRETEQTETEAESAIEQTSAEAD